MSDAATDAVISFETSAGFLMEFKREVDRLMYEYGKRPTCVFVSSHLLAELQERLDMESAPLRRCHPDLRHPRRKILNYEVFEVVEPNVIKAAL